MFADNAHNYKNTVFYVETYVTILRCSLNGDTLITDCLYVRPSLKSQGNIIWNSILLRFTLFVWYPFVCLSHCSVTKYISSLGEDVHDYHKFKNSERRLRRKPYLNNSEDFVYINSMANSSTVLKNLQNSGNMDLRGMQVYNSNINNQSSTADLNYSYDRSEDILQQMINFTR